MLSVPITIVSAVIGSVIVFQIVKTSFGAALAEKAGPLVQRLSRGFAENAFSLLLFLRLAPVFPFCAVNAVAGLCRVPLRSFIAATIIGIIPASIAFALIGSGLDGVIDVQMASYKVVRRGAGCGELQFHAGALLPSHPGTDPWPRRAGPRVADPARCEALEAAAGMIDGHLDIGDDGGGPAGNHFADVASKPVTNRVIRVVRTLRS